MATTTFINEFHYDNAGADSGEGFEIAGAAGTSLAGWKVVFYNGGTTAASAQNAVQYRTVDLTGVIADQQNGFGTLSFTLPTDAVQNGAPDGFALIDAGGAVVQFLSYEGVLRAADGPAAGLTSTDIGVSEAGTTPVGSSLRLTGTGTTYEDFIWAPAAPNSFGAVNSGQTFGATVAAPTLSIADASAAEGNAGTTALTFTVTRSGNLTAASSASYAVTFGTATADDLSGALTGTVAFAAGQDSATVTVQIAGDVVVEGDEAFTVTLSDPTGATLDDATATGTIANDDRAAVTGTAFINELLYDPAGADTNERVEIAGTAGLNLIGWSLVLYNGNGGAPYRTIALSGVITDQDDGSGALAFDAPGIQNGAPDGLALVDAGGRVVQFLSYEGSFTAVGGPADGLTSTDIGVSQSGTEPNTVSLQLKGNGFDAESFTWTAASASSFGQVNAGQNFIAANPAGTLRVRDASVTEGDDGVREVAFTVTRSGGAGGAFSLRYDVVFDEGAGQANAADFSGDTGGLIAFADGQTEATIRLAVAGDTVGEPDERFTLRISDPTGPVTIGDGEATGTIVNDDLARLAVYEIQGLGHRSAFAGQTVVTTGVVTALGSNGYYLQDVTGDGDTRTSDAIFVFTGSAPTGVAVGDRLEIAGRIDEFAGSADALPITQISPRTVTLLEANAALPTAVLIGPDGVRPPTENLEDDGFTSYDPATDGLDFFESIEGMRVTVQSPVAVAPSVGGSVYTVASRDGDDLVATGLSKDGFLVIDGGAGGLGVTNSGAGSDFNPERILIGSLVSGGVPRVTAGTEFADVTGVVSYRSGSYTVLAGSAPTVVAAGPDLSDQTTTFAGNDSRLIVATYNILNLDPNDADGDRDVAEGRFDLIGRQIGVRMGAPGIVVLEEVQDNDGSANTGVTSASVTLQTLVDAIFAASGVRYSFLDNPFIADNASGGEPGSNIRVAFLYRDDIVDFQEGSLRTVPGATQNPGDPFASARPPLVGDFAFNGETVTVIGNHFTSKGGGSALSGSIQPSVAGGEVKRTQQAAVVNDFVDTLLAADADANIIVAGDLNEFQFEEPLGVLTGELTFDGAAITGTGPAVLQNLTYLLPENERYSYVFEGNAQQIDHILVTGALSAGAVTEILHINRDEFASDHDPVLAALDIGVAVVRQDGTAASETLTGTTGRDRLGGLDGDDRLRGFAGDDILVGGSGNDTLEGGAGDDRMQGGAGNDSYIVDASGDRVEEGADAGFDTVKTTLVAYTLGANVEVLQFQTAADATGAGNELNNTLFGNAGADTLRGLAGDDRLVGGAGDDLLIGGTGRDSMEGGAGADRFVFAAGDLAALARPDTIRDFDVNGGDLIDLSALGALSFIGSDGFNGQGSGELRYQQQGRFTFVYGDLDGDGRADFAVQLEGVNILSEDDFVLASGMMTM